MIPEKPKLLIDHYISRGNNHWRSLFRCACGKEFIADRWKCENGHTKSCGCYKKAKAKSDSTTHGLSDINIKLYDSWKHMNSRVNNAKDKNYIHYGSRGIKICSEWKNYINFYNWANANGYKEGLILDRIDVNGNYEPKNCRWVSAEISSQNRRCNMTENEVKQVLRYLSLGYRIKNIAIKMNRNRATIWAIANQKSWKNITVDNTSPKQIEFELK